jgi:hypothetical protein
MNAIFCILQLISGGISLSVSCKIYTDVSEVPTASSTRRHILQVIKPSVTVRRISKSRDRVTGFRAWQPRNRTFGVGRGKVTTASEAHPKASEAWK